MIAHCNKCREKKPVADIVRTTLKNGRPAIRGKCTACGTGIFKIVARGTQV